MSNIQIKPKIKSKIVSQFIFLHDKRRRRSTAPKSIFYVSSNIPNPATSLTGTENTTAPASVSAPARVIIERMMSAFCSLRATMRITSFSFAIDTPRNFSLSGEVVLLPLSTVPPIAPAARRVHDGVRAPLVGYRDNQFI